MPGSRAYEEGMAEGKRHDATEFDNPYSDGTEDHRQWKLGFEYSRGTGDNAPLLA